MTTTFELCLYNFPITIPKSLTNLSSEVTESLTECSPKTVKTCQIFSADSWEEKINFGFLSDPIAVCCCY